MTHRRLSINFWTAISSIFLVVFFFLLLYVPFVSFYFSFYLFSLFCKLEATKKLQYSLWARILHSWESFSLEIGKKNRMQSGLSNSSLRCLQSKQEEKKTKVEWELCACICACACDCACAECWGKSAKNIWFNPSIWTCKQNRMLRWLRWYHLRNVHNLHGLRIRTQSAS